MTWTLQKGSACNRSNESIKREGHEVWAGGAGASDSPMQTRPGDSLKLFGNVLESDTFELPLTIYNLPCPVSARQRFCSFINYM